MALTRFENAGGEERKEGKERSGGARQLFLNCALVPFSHLRLENKQDYCFVHVVLHGLIKVKDLFSNLHKSLAAVKK